MSTPTGLKRRGDCEPHATTKASPATWRPSARTAAVTDARAEAEATKLKAAAELEAELARGRAQLHMQITAHGGAGLQLKEERTCVVCYESCHGYDGGIECRGSNPHFMCNECVVASVQSLITDELNKQDLRGGRSRRHRRGLRGLRAGDLQCCRCREGRRGEHLHGLCGPDDRGSLLGNDRVHLRCVGHAFLQGEGVCRC